ncbi:MAG: hypothetical protein LBB61_06835 [Treponema sp.]|nr:hypothetical protein [Treponema sp.]
MAEVNGGEHIFYIVKRLFGYWKVVYRGIMKNGGRMLFANPSSVKMGVGDESCQTGCSSVIGRAKALLNGVKAAGYGSNFIFCPVKHLQTHCSAINRRFPSTFCPL